MGTGPHTHTGTRKCQGQGSPLTCKIHWENISPTVTLFLPQPQKAGPDAYDPLNLATSEKSNLYPSSRCGSLRVPEPQKVPPAQGPSPIQITAGAAWTRPPSPAPQPGWVCHRALGLRLPLAEVGQSREGSAWRRAKAGRPNPGTDCSTFSRKVSLESQPDLGRNCEGVATTAAGTGRSKARTAPLLVPPLAKSLASVKKESNSAASPGEIP